MRHGFEVREIIKEGKQKAKTKVNMRERRLQLGDPASFASPKHVLVVFSFAVVHVWDVQTIEALASELVSPPEALQVLSNRLQELVLKMAMSVRAVEMWIDQRTLGSLIRGSPMTILSERFFFSLCYRRRIQDGEKKD